MIDGEIQYIYGLAVVGVSVRIEIGPAFSVGLPIRAPSVGVAFCHGSFIGIGMSDGQVQDMVA